MDKVNWYIAGFDSPTGWVNAEELERNPTPQELDVATRLALNVEGNYVTIHSAGVGFDYDIIPHEIEDMMSDGGSLDFLAATRG